MDKKYFKWPPHLPKVPNITQAKTPTLARNNVKKYLKEKSIEICKV